MKSRAHPTPPGRHREGGPENTGRKQKPQLFGPGQSGNPNGRPQGSRNKTTLAVEALLDGEAEALTRKAVELAKNGDRRDSMVAHGSLARWRRAPAARLP